MVPAAVWRINSDPPPDSVASFAAEGGSSWWEQVDLVKLILAANQIKEIPDDIQLLPALTVLDVSFTVGRAQYDSLTSDIIWPKLSNVRL